MVRRHMNLHQYADTIEKATLTVSGNLLVCLVLTGFLQTIAEGKSITGDLGGKANTEEYTKAIIAKI
jgi:isocitrate dehydrogenase (NAD+)